MSSSGKNRIELTDPFALTYIDRDTCVSLPFYVWPHILSLLLASRTLRLLSCDSACLTLALSLALSLSRRRFGTRSLFPLLLAILLLLPSYTLTQASYSLERHRVHARDRVPEERRQISSSLLLWTCLIEVLSTVSPSLPLLAPLVSTSSFLALHASHSPSDPLALLSCVSPAALLLIPPFTSCLSVSAQRAQRGSRERVSQARGMRSSGIRRTAAAAASICRHQIKN